MRSFMPLPLRTLRRSGQIQVFQAQFFHFAQAHPALPQQVKGGPVQQGQAALAGDLCCLHARLDLLAQLFHLLIGEVPGQAVGRFQAGNAQEGLGHGVAFFLQEEQEGVQRRISAFTLATE